MREFLFVDDLAEACVFLLQNYFEPLHINVGSNEEVSIKELAQMVADVVGYKGELVHDLSKPDGTPRKKTDCSRITELGWKPRCSLSQGLPFAYADFLGSFSNGIFR